MIIGPAEYIPPVEVEIITKRYAIALDDNDGIYVRNIKTGHVSTFKNLFFKMYFCTIGSKKMSALETFNFKKSDNSSVLWLKE